ncbi:MAG: hypothetical protein KU28_00735 [Sulfurovum sp. PC08-66]|nr:MAG: hypothetical protein KU28_00735 [Sulfurovum sp. PC08-66]KIM12492.1 MAG: hypothetical protein KU37_00850 [Sulfuricurvum sp. PC08-66]
MKILLVEDDTLLGETLEDILRADGYTLVWVTSFEGALDATFEERFDLYLLDVNLLDGNGFELLKALRQANDTTPAFFITALSDMASLQEAFAVGADDYIKKPFAIEELRIRIHAKLQARAKVLRHGTVTWEHNALYKEGKPIDIPAMQRQIFLLLLENQGHVVDMQHLLDLLESPTEQALRVHINKIKTTLDAHITNIRGVGYRLETR